MSFTIAHLILIAVSNSIVVFLRLLTSAEIKTNPDYAAFLLHPETGEQMDPEGFCNNFVEAVGKEAGGSSSISSRFSGRPYPIMLSAWSFWAMPPPCGLPDVAKDRCCLTRENCGRCMMSSLHVQTLCLVCGLRRTIPLIVFGVGG